MYVWKFAGKLNENKLKIPENFTTQEIVVKMTSDDWVPIIRMTNVIIRFLDIFSATVCFLMWPLSFKNSQTTFAKYMFENHWKSAGKDLVLQTFQSTLVRCRCLCIFIHKMCWLVQIFQLLVREVQLSAMH